MRKANKILTRFQDAKAFILSFSKLSKIFRQSHNFWNSVLLVLTIKLENYVYRMHFVLPEFIVQYCLLKLPISLVCTAFKICRKYLLEISSKNVLNFKKLLLYLFFKTMQYLWWLEISWPGVRFQNSPKNTLLFDLVDENGPNKMG